MKKRSCLLISFLTSTFVACGPAAPTEGDAGAPPPPQDAGTPVQPVDSGQPDVAPPPEPVCGNGVVEEGEACDDGNQTQTDACKNNCQYNFCGDGIVYSAQEQCDDGNTINGDGCTTVCLIEEPVSVTVNVTGRVRQGHYADFNAASGASVRAINVLPPQNTQSNGAGSYALNGLPPGSVVMTDIAAADTDCTLPGVNNCNAGGFATRTVLKTYNDAAETIDLTLVDFEWWIEQSIRCGAFANEAEAYAGKARFSGIYGRLEAADGTPVAAVNRDGINLSVEGNVNTEKACFLERYDPGTPNDTSDDKLRVALDANGSPVVQSNETGFFVIFKTQNAQGIGSFVHAVSAPTFGEVRLTLQAGQVGYIQLKTANPPVPPEDLIDFESAVFPVFRRNGCVVCHMPNGPGAVSPVNAPGQYPMILDGDASEVYEAIVGPAGEGARLNFDSPVDSLLITMPLLEYPANHPNASFETVQVADAALLIDWIAQGAPRYATIREPGLEDAQTLTDIVELSDYAGCTACHYAERNANFDTSLAGDPYGNLPLDGCIPFYNYPAEYAPTNNTLPVGLQPDAENQRCVYYHLVKQQVATDPYATNYRVNVAEPDKSLLLRNAYCGLDECAEGAEPPEYHPVRLFFSKTEGPYVYVKSWIENGALNDGTYGADLVDGGAPDADAGSPPDLEDGSPEDGGTP